MDEKLRTIADKWLASPFLERYREIGEKMVYEIERMSEAQKPAVARLRK